MSEHQYDIRISESCVDPNPLMVEIQDPDNFTRFQTLERCALEIAAYVFNKLWCKIMKCACIYLCNILQNMNECRSCTVDATT